MTSKREIKEGISGQGVEEEIAYTLTTTPWGSTPTNTSVKVYTIASDGTRTDVTTTVMPAGGTSVVGDVITLPPLKSLTAGLLYRVEVKFTCSGNLLEAFGYIKGEY